MKGKWKKPFILLNGAILQPWGVFLRVPCQGNSILATVGNNPLQTSTLQPYDTPLLLLNTQMHISGKTCQWLHSLYPRRPGVFYPTHRDVTL